ncbi:hypothetical protein CYMTET_35994 [Cymbomonas tetramitiformis]|uniref:Uncharacterized protein n=1 Tax=Cymbomonas tetramitiformis TaxID=36881 RepID=A0AAE0F847_9CHLO|nr:hypothetical protein CYMTET_35994 [Cymbomonas tetramitiformis]
MYAPLITLPCGWSGVAPGANEHVLRAGISPSTARATLSAAVRKCCSAKQPTGGGAAGKDGEEALILVARGINLGPPHLWGPEEIHTWVQRLEDKVGAASAGALPSAMGAAALHALRL